MSNEDKVTYGPIQNSSRFVIVHSLQNRPIKLPRHQNFENDAWNLVLEEMRVVAQESFNMMQCAFENKFSGESGPRAKDMKELETRVTECVSSPEQADGLSLEGRSAQEALDCFDDRDRQAKWINMMKAGGMSVKRFDRFSVKQSSEFQFTSLTRSIELQLKLWMCIEVTFLDLGGAPFKRDEVCEYTTRHRFQAGESRRQAFCRRIGRRRSFTDREWHDETDPSDWLFEDASQISTSRSATTQSQTSVTTDAHQSLPRQSSNVPDRTGTIESANPGTGKSVHFDLT